VIPDERVVGTCTNVSTQSAATLPATPEKPCPICGKQIPNSAIKCILCDSPLGGPACVTCGAPIPLKAKRCWQCDSFQDWRKRIPGDNVTLALLLSILSIIGILAPEILHFINLRSRTSGFFLDADHENKKYAGQHFITVRLTNDGGRSAQVEEDRGAARIDFKRTVSDRSRVLGADLDIVNRGAMIIRAGRTVDLALNADNLTFVGAPADDAPSIQKDNYRHQIAQDLCTTDAVLTINIRGRDRFNRLEKARPVTMAMTRDKMNAWVLERTIGNPQGEINCP
jgi:predicted nucleic acid-binding Zn ribbon protein